MHKANFNIIHLLNEIKKSQLNKAEEKGIKLKLRKDPELPEWVFGDDGVLRQVLNSLIDNAIKFTESGTIMVDSEVNNKSGESIFLDFSVSDTGAGISPEKQPLIFKDTTSTQPSGLDPSSENLKLPYIKNRIEQQGGGIQVSSEPGQGSTFYFTLPFLLNLKEDPVPDAEDNQLYNLEKLRAQTENNEDFVKNLVHLFIESTPDMLNQMKNELKNKNLDQVAKIAHKLKPPIDMLEIISQQERIRNIEKHAKNKEGLENLTKMVEALSSDLEKVINQLKKD